MKTILSLFPKFYRHLGVDQLAELVQEVGLDTTNVVVRDGYWVNRESIRTSLPAFVKAMKKHGLTIHFATEGSPAASLVRDPTPLAVLADNGITDARIGYFTVEKGDVRASFESARQQMYALAGVCERYGIRVIYQVHHGMLITNSVSAWQVIGGLSPRHVGVELDPGNQSWEGSENWRNAVSLLGDYLAAAGIKDTNLLRDESRADAPDKGWRRAWAPIYDGVTNWFDFVSALNRGGFHGTLVLMPFYDESDPVSMTKKLKREVAYLRLILESVEPG